MKINKITPQIAALYLGQKCDIVWKTSHGFAGISKGEVWRDRQIDHSTTAWLENAELEITPHLRRLESLTEDDARELFEVYMGKKWEVERPCLSSWWKDRDEWYQSMATHSIGYPEIWLKLLEWGIDLFGLIDSGLAKEVEPTDENGLTASDYYHGITYPNG